MALMAFFRVVLIIIRIAEEQRFMEENRKKRWFHIQPIAKTKCALLNSSRLEHIIRSTHTIFLYFFLCWSSTLQCYIIHTIFFAFNFFLLNFY